MRMNQRRLPDKQCEVCGGTYRPRKATQRFCTKPCRYLDARGFYIDLNGYRMVPGNGHPNQHRNGYIAEHRLIMSNILGRPLRKGESVHHIDGDRQHNDPSNLQLRGSAHGKGHAHICNDCGSSNIQHIQLAE